MRRPRNPPQRNVNHHVMPMISGPLSGTVMIAASRLAQPTLQAYAVNVAKHALHGSTENQIQKTPKPVLKANQYSVRGRKRNMILPLGTARGCALWVLRPGASDIDYANSQSYAPTQKESKARGPIPDNLTPGVAHLARLLGSSLEEGGEALRQLPLQSQPTLWLDVRNGLQQIYSKGHGTPSVSKVGVVEMRSSNCLELM